MASIADAVVSGFSTGRLLLAAYVSLALGVFDNDGQYSPVGLALTLVSFALYAFAVARVGRRRGGITPPPEPALAGALILLLVFGAIKAPALWLHDLEFIRTTEFVVFSLAVGTGAAHVFFPKQRLFAWVVFAGGVLGALVLRWGVLRASPAPFIDVFELAQQGSGYLLKGFNPYSNPYWAAGHDGHIYVFNGYAYPPGNLLLQSVVFALTKDARYANVLADVTFAGCLWLVTRGLTTRTRQLLVLLHLFQPKALFVLENAWTEPLTLGCFGLWLWLWRRGTTGVAAAIAGFMLSMKHYLVFIVPQFLILERRWRFWAILCGAGLATVVPFLVADAKSFWMNGLMLVVSLPFSNQTLGLVSFVNRTTGWVPGPELSIGVGLISCLAFPFLLRRAPPVPRYLLSITGTLFATFLFGSKAFCNYYYLVSGLMVMALALHAEQVDWSSPVVKSENEPPPQPA